MSERIRKTIEGLGEIELSGIKLSQPTKELLDVGELDINVHVAMQPACIAYYGALKKDALRNLAALKRAFEKWQYRKRAEAKVKASVGNAKPTINDIEARYIVDNAKEIEDWEERLDKAQDQADTLEVWFEAWKQKSHTIREYCEIDSEAMRAGDSIGNGGESKTMGGTINDANSIKIQRVRDIIRKRREQEESCD